MSNVYRPKFLVPGFKINRYYSGFLMVAVPEQKLKTLPLRVVYQEKEMVITDEKDQLERMMFKDRFGRGFYFLCYFIFNPTEQIRLF